MTKILVVEDDKFLTNAYKVKLAKAGFELYLASNGDEALAQIASCRPDVVLLDLIMPLRDGFSVLEMMKKNVTMSKIPGIIASNLGQKSDIDRGLKLGAVDYIVKSDTSMDAIVQKVRKAIQNK
jgi:PleD family two-component response regulator